MITRYAWRSSIDNEFYNGTESVLYFSDLSIGTHAIYLKVQDDYGVWSNEVSTSLTITEYVPTNTPPTVSFTSHTNGTTVSGTVTIAGVAHDPDGDTTLTKVEMSIDDGEWFNVTGTESWQFNWDASEMENGDYDFRVRAYDGESYSEVRSLRLKLEKGDTPGDDDDDDDDSPGFGAGAALLAVIVVVASVAFRRKKA